MNQITMRPGFRAAGAEVSDIEVGGKYAGTMTLAYREGDRLVGAIQLDRTMLAPGDKAAVSDWADGYVHSLADALDVAECEVLVTYGRFDHIVTAYVETSESLADGSEDGPGKARTTGGSAQADRDAAAPGIDGGSDLRPLRLELVIVGEHDNRIEYHIYGENREWLAEAFFTIGENDVYGEVNWMRQPDGEEMEAAADLIVSDFDDREIDMFRIDMKVEGSVIETYELTHKDLLPIEDREGRQGKGEKTYTAVLVRDDADSLTYDLYEQTQGGLPVGRATVDISTRELTGMIDFRDKAGSADREKMATALLDELDKEKDYDSVNLTMMHRNKRIENIYFENQQVH